MSPVSWSRVYVVDRNARVWFTPDAGSTWEDITGDLNVGAGNLHTKPRNALA